MGDRPRLSRLRARRADGREVVALAAGNYHTKLVWSKLTWLDYAQLRIDITDLTYASKVAADDGGRPNTAGDRRASNMRMSNYSKAAMDFHKEEQMKMTKDVDEAFSALDTDGSGDIDEDEVCSVRTREEVEGVLRRPDGLGRN